MTDTQVAEIVTQLQRIATALEKQNVVLLRIKDAAEKVATAPPGDDKSVFDHIFGKPTR